MTTARRDDVIACILARDADAGDNANLTYRLMEGGYHGSAYVVRVDVDLGCVRLNIDLDELEDDIAILLKLVVSDRGFPPLNVTSQLKVRGGVKF